MNVARSTPVFLMALLAACGGTHDTTVPHEAAASDGSAPAPSLEVWAAEAVDTDPEVANRAIDALRAAGPAGLAAMLAAHDADVTRLRGAPISATREQLEALRQDESLQRLRTAIDRIAAQRDAFASGLYWYTDLAEAQAEASRSGRPILSLRLLGRLDEEASCANSRLFRWMLYPSPAVQEALAGYVLHWSSERPAPHVTIDMGDGRTIERTITGNSVHYVLDASGNVIDAITGLHTPDDFVVRLAEAHAVAEHCGMRFADRACLRTEHERLLQATRTAWDLVTALGQPSWDTLVSLDVPVPAAPSVALAEPLTIGKMAMEMPIVRLLGDAPAVAPAPSIAWDVVASIGATRGRWSPMPSSSLALARLKTGNVDDAAMLEASWERARRDTVQNRFTLERRLHAWLASDVPNDFASLNARVYTELFLTPASDPWLGLRSDTLWDVMEVSGSTDGRN